MVTVAVVASGVVLATATPSSAVIASRTGVTSYDRMAPGAPHNGYFDSAWQPFTAQSNTITALGVTVGSLGYTGTTTTVRIRLCSNTVCTITYGETNPVIVNYGNSQGDIGDVAVNPGQTYYVVYSQPASWSGHVWYTYWWAGGTTIVTSDQMQAIVLGYNRTAPDSPTITAATPGTGSATVSFAAPANNGSAITSYRVTAADVTSSARGGQMQTGAGTPITVHGLTGGDSYTFVVTATNGFGAGPASAPSAQVVPVGIPGAPTAVVATPSDSAASVAFTSPPANGSAITSYQVRSIDLTNAARGGQTSKGTSSPVMVSGLTNGDTYQFTVAATNGVGAGPASVASASITPTVIVVTGSLPMAALYSKADRNLYSHTLTATGGNAPYRWTLIGSSPLPPGLKLKPRGLITGKAAAIGSYTFTVQVADKRTKGISGVQNVTTTTMTLQVTKNPDINGDGVVGCIDLGILQAQYAMSGSNLAGDLDGNGTVDLADLQILSTAWGIGQPATC